MKIMAMWGFFPFSLKTIPYNSLDKSSAYRHAGQTRIGVRDGNQFLGIGEESISFAGVAYPEQTGGRNTIELLKAQAESGRSFPLIERNGRIHGFYVCESIGDNSSLFLHDGNPQKIEFSIKLKRVSEDTLNLVGIITSQIGGLL